MLERLAFTFDELDVMQHQFEIHQERRVSLQTSHSIISGFLSRNSPKTEEAPLQQQERLNALSEDVVEKIGKVLAAIDDQLAESQGTQAKNIGDEHWPKAPVLPPKKPEAKGQGAPSEDNPPPPHRQRP